MLARRSLPAEYRAWNHRWGAPFGRAAGLRELAPDPLRKVTSRFPRIGGPFAVQSNNDTREVEYPWAFHATPVTNGISVVEIGGGLSGFQFVLAKSGARVINVDPGEEATGVGFYCTPASIARLNRAFRTDVQLVNATLDQAGLADESIDTIYSISTIEHIPEAELPGVAAEMRRILRPGGHVVLTIDLFLDLVPFTARTRNRYGWNIDVKRLVDHLGCELVVGDEAELYGYPAFRSERVLEQLSELHYGAGYPASAQLLMLEKSP